MQAGLMMDHDLPGLISCIVSHIVMYHLVPHYYNYISTLAFLLNPHYIFHSDHISMSPSSLSAMVVRKLTRCFCDDANLEIFANRQRSWVEMNSECRNHMA